MLLWTGELAGRANGLLGRRKAAFRARSTVVLSRGLLEQLSRPEIDALMARQFHHVSRGALPIGYCLSSSS